VKHSLSIEDLVPFLESQNIKINTRQLEQLNLYREKLLYWNRKHNLISRGDEKNIVEKHFLPAFLYVYFLMRSGYGKENKLSDIGSGGGFPGIIISIFFPDREVALIESIRKKAIFLKSIIRDLNLNAWVINERIEQQENKFDIVTARALAGIGLLDSFADKLLTNGGKLFSIKGKDFHKEINGELKLSLIDEDIPKKWIELSDNLNNKKMIMLKKD
jgi:16S rRNA (guanine527-N7)-methyltransferase